MRIDESLARGFTRDFLTRLDEESVKFLDRIEPAELAYVGDLSTKKAANRFCKSLDAIAAKSPIVLHHMAAGTRNHAHWWALYLRCHPNRQDDVWKERVLSVEIERVWLFGQKLQPTYSNAVVGKHCITRLFQRISWDSMPSTFSILEELKYLTEVLPWHIAAHAHIAAMHNGLRLSKFIPTPHGVFLGVSHPTDVALMKLATFVSYDQLSDLQKELWVFLYAVQSQPEIREHLSLQYDPTFKLAEAQKYKWWPVNLQFVFLIMNFARLLQRELDALHPNIIWSDSKGEMVTWDERRQQLMEGLDFKDNLQATLRSEAMEKRREAARKRASVLTNN